MSKFENEFAKRVANSGIDYQTHVAGDEALLDSLPGSHQPKHRQDGSNAPQPARDKELP